MGKFTAYAKICGITKTAAAEAISSDWPRNIRMGLEKMYMMLRRTPAKVMRTVDLCKYTPSISYFWAPYACPHRVSTALPIPNCLKN